MAQQAPECPVGYSSSSTSPTGGFWEHAPIPSWSPYAGIATDPVAFCTDLTSLTHTGLPGRSTGAPGSSTEHVGSNGYGMDFLSLLEARKAMPEMLEDFPTAACDYLKGLDGGACSSMAGSAPYGLHSASQCTGSSALPIRNDEYTSSPLECLGNSTLVQDSIMVRIPCHSLEVKRDGNQQQAPVNAFLQQMLPSSVAIQGSSLGYSSTGNGMVFPEDQVMDDARSLPDAVSFSEYRSDTELTRANQHVQHITSLQARTCSRNGSGAASGLKKRKSEEKLGGSQRKSKQDTSHTSPPKVTTNNEEYLVNWLKLFHQALDILVSRQTQTQAPVGEREKVIALQHIVSPYGKTDRASVLLETIKHIEYLYEQIQLYSEPYIENSTKKVHFQWGGQEEQKAGVEHDLRSRGLCLVPVSCTPQLLRDNSLLDCLTPPYKSSLYQ
ncbi:uncharacterized protein LOC100833856 isoform X2 [Brachypodium distachyon]|uniref:uncharacterized protein LOC100833856 isoform X2 n=1 Tax=Brachypodium distachyon TaxID=15368 RepID=UPI0001C706C7|nr:uncharacterized protein LOC100833856 isoform X2 [Brachypodium distachyon]|eukprot:XP_024311532.1 uncharacterized protein LOC100833856 isoform X2 [Brachypodium distachyon]